MANLFMEDYLALARNFSVFRLWKPTILSTFNPILAAGKKNAKYCQNLKNHSIFVFIIAAYLNSKIIACYDLS